MNSNSAFLPRLAALTTSAVLSGCGGGSGSSTPEPPSEGPLACVALPDEITWHRDAGSSEWNDVLIDGRNRIWIAGWSNGIVGQSNVEPAGDSRAVVRQLAPNGALLWDAGSAFDTPGTDAAEALALGAQGTVYVAGRTNGSLGGTPNAGQFDTFVAWTDSPGTPAPWRLFQTGTERPQLPRRLAVDDRGGLLLAGQDDDYVLGNSVAAWSDAFAMRMERLEAGGTNDRLTVRWTLQANSAESDMAGGLAALPAGAGPATFVSGSVQGGSASGMYLRKLDTHGTVLWTARYSTVAVDHVAVVRSLPGADLLIAGSVFGPFRGGAAQGQQDIFVARVSADDGHVLQSWQVGTVESEWLADLQVDAAGNVIVLGETTGSVVADRANAGGYDLFMMKLSPDGRVLAARQWGTDKDERAGRLALDSCGRVVAVGSSGDKARRDAITWFWQP